MDYFSHIPKNFRSIYYIFMYIYALRILLHCNTVVSQNPRNPRKSPASEKWSHFDSALPISQLLQIR